MNGIEEPTAAPGQTQPWRAWWPPKEAESLTDDELRAKPWVHWKPDPSVPNEKPWLQWVPRDAHIFERPGSGGGGGTPAPTPPVPPSSNAEGG